MAKALVNSVAEGHRLHLKALARQERGSDYQRQDYLSPVWQRSLLRRRDGQHGEDAIVTIEEESSGQQTIDVDAKRPQQRESPTSTASSTSLIDFDTSVVSSLEVCIQWRARIIEWKYQVVDRFGTSI